MPYLIEVSVCTGIIYLTYLVFFRNSNNWQFNRFYFLGGTLLAILIPLLNIPIIDGFNIPALTEVNANRTGQVLTNQLGFDETSKEIPYLKILYILGLIFSLVQLSYAIIQLIIKKKNFTKAKILNQEVWFTHGKMPNSSFFNQIFWDETKNKNNTEEEAILYHEHIHIKQYHSIDIIYIELIKSVLWFNPFIYLIRNSIKQIHEYYTDSKVVERFTVESYSNLIIDNIFGLNLTNQFSAKNIKYRLKVLHSKKIEV